MKWGMTLASMLMVSGASWGQVPTPSVPQTLNTWYQHYLGHGVDQQAMNSWGPQFGEVPPQVVLARILSEHEYYDRNGETPDGLVLGLYRDVLGRTPNSLRPQDVEYWVNKMNQYGSAEAMIEEFLHDANTNIFSPPAAPAAPAFPQYGPPTQLYGPGAQQYSPPAYTPGAAYNPGQQYALPVPSPWHWHHEMPQGGYVPYRR